MRGLLVETRVECFMWVRIEVRLACLGQVLKLGRVYVRLDVGMRRLDVGSYHADAFTMQCV